MGPRGLTGPPGKTQFPSFLSHLFLFLIGRDGFIERPPSFYAELRRLFITKNMDGRLQPWTLSESANTPDVLNYFSPETGIFTVPTGGLYHFFLTISVSKAKVRENYFFSNHFFFVLYRHRFIFLEMENVFVRFG